MIRESLQLLYKYFTYAVGKTKQKDDRPLENYYLSLCCIIKDENEYLEEWMKYHLKTGVQHFYIYDNGSNVPVYNILNDLETC